MYRASSFGAAVEGTSAFQRQTLDETYSMRDGPHRIVTFPDIQDLNPNNVDI
jgi:hypothetical protein